MTGALFIYHVDKDPPDQDINLFVRVTNRFIPGWIFVPALSPSERLLKRLEGWRWDRKWPRMWPEFARAYRKELTENPLKYMHVKHLLKRLNEGNNIAIACDCHDEWHCHKQLIGEWIGKRKVEVIQGKEIREERKEKAFVHPTNIEQLTLHTVVKGESGRWRVR